jgi:hypothetical protein
MEGKSCEMLAGIIIGLMQGKYGLGRKYRVEVLEDGENGAVVDWV